MKASKYSCGPLIAAIKRELKVQSRTYRDVAQALGVSENSIKVRFSQKRLSFEQIMAIAELLGLTMSELMKKMEQPPIRQLSVVQEATLVSDLRLLLITICIMDHWTIDDIVAVYDISKPECIKYLLELERIGLIEVLPNDRIRKRIDRGLDWVPNGPFHRFVANRMADFLDSRFDQKLENRLVLRAVLTPAAIEQLQSEMRLLKQKLAELHEESLIAPFDQRHSIVLFMAERDWEMKEFRALRRHPKLSPGQRPGHKGT